MRVWLPGSRSSLLGALFDDIEVNQMSTVSDFLRDEAGANAAEYALILLVISISLVAALSAIGNSIANSFNAAKAGIAS